MESSIDETDRHEREARVQTLTDEQIEEWEVVIGCLLSERDAFRRLATEYLDVVRAGALKAIEACKGAVSCTVEDLVQEFYKDVFTDAQAVLGNFDALAGPFKPWLVQVVVFHSMKVLRSKNVRWPGRLAPTASADLSAIADAHETRQHLTDKVLRLLAQLSARSQDVLKARLGMEPHPKRLSVREIAKQRNLTPRQVYHILDRIVRVRLRRSRPQRPLRRRRDKAG